MDARRIVIGLEVGELSLEVTCVPKQHMVEKLSPNCADQPLNKWMRKWNVGHGFDFIDLQNPQIRWFKPLDRAIGPNSVSSSCSVPVMPLFGRDDRVTTWCHD